MNTNTKYTEEQIADAQEYMTDNIMIDEIEIVQTDGTGWMSFSVGDQYLSTSFTLQDLDALMKMVAKETA
jgi:hypothetical protein